MAFTPRRQRPLRMNPRSRRGRLARVPALAALLLLTTCTEDHNPFSPGKTWITPTGQVTADPPALLVGAGDIASCSSTGDDATAKLLDSISGTVFTIGDDAYENGSSSDFTKCYHPNWGRHKARTKPSAGNHEYQTSGATGYFNYYGTAGGEPGKGYYSYDVGDWHVIVLNSNISMSAGSTQEQWLKADLAANPRFCKLAYWHHPLYASTSGTGSGGVTESKVRPIWDDLYASGADLVLGGHRHMYERQAPQKPDRTADPVYGIREIVAGTGGESHISPTNVSKNSEVRNGDTYGVLKLWLYADSYAWKFVPIAGKTFSDSGSTACHGAPGSGVAVSASRSTVAAAPASLPAGNGSSTITVTVKDANGNPISGATVVLSGTGNGNTLTQPSNPTNSSGVATGTLSSTVAEAKTVSARANGTAITQTASVTVNPGPVSTSRSTVTASPTSLPAGAGTSTISVTAKDASGNPISGATVVLVATGSGNTLTQPSGTTDASGVAAGTLSSSVAEVKTVSATINGTAVTQTATLAVTAGAISASQSTVSASPTSLAAGSGSSTITVTVKDAGGNPISGVTVILSATGSGNTLSQPSGTTNASGAATGILSSTVAEAKTLSATADGTALTQTAMVTVSAGSVSASASTLAAAPTFIALESGTSTITVTAQDANGNPISGATVFLAVTGSDNTLTQPSGPTDASGVATGTLSSTGAETKTISATIDGAPLTETATVTVLPAPVSASQSTLTASPTALTAGSASATITVTARDAGGNPISGATVVLAATGAGNTLTQPTGPTGALSATVAEPKTVAATANGTAITQEAGVTVAAGSVSAAQSTVGGSPASIVVASGTSTITVTAQDANGNPISGATVVLAATGSGNTLTQPSGPTDASGVATGTLSSTAAETKTISATIDGAPLTQTAMVTVLSAPVSASQATLTASPPTLPAGSASATIAVMVRVPGGNPIVGATVVLAATGAGNTLTQPTGPTDASGVATGALSSTVAESKTVSATIDGTAAVQTATVTVAAGSVSASQSTVAAAPASILPGTGTATITGTARDAGGNPISGATVVLSATGSGNTLTQPAGPTDAEGVATGTLASTVAGSKGVSAAANGTRSEETAALEVTAGPVSAAQSALAASPSSIPVGTGTATITVTARDASGNPISGATVVLAATGSGNTLTQSSGPTDAIGVATGTLSSSVAESKTVSATINGTAVTQTATVTVTSGSVSASQSTVAASPTSIAVGG